MLPYSLLAHCKKSPRVPPRAFRLITTHSVPLRASHAVPAVVAQVAIPVSYRDRAAVVATGGVELELGELLAAVGMHWAAVAVDFQGDAGTLQRIQIESLRRAV